MRVTQKAFPLLTNKVTTGVDKTMDVESFRHIILAIDTANSFSGTIQVQGSINDQVISSGNTQGDTIPPTWTNAATFSNQWSYIQLIDLQDGSTVNGSTGIVATGTDVHRLFEVNTNGLKWLTVNVTARVAGGVYAVAKPFNDND
jgi:hypothetical protein